MRETLSLYSGIDPKNHDAPEYVHNMSQKMFQSIFEYLPENMFQNIFFEKLFYLK